MYYDPEKNDHGLARSPFKSCVVPRPIGWISTMSAAGVHNLAPYSQFQNLGFDPAYVMISANQGEPGKRKDTVVNIEETGEFTVNVPAEGMDETVAYCGQVSGREHDKFKERALTMLDGRSVKSPMIEECIAYFECKVIGKSTLIPDLLSEEVLKTGYPSGNYHTLYFGKILSSLMDQ